MPSEQGKNSPLERSQTVRRPANNRSRVTNGSSLLPSIDGRSLWARRFRDLLSLHLSDLGGEDNCSEAEKALSRRSACLIVELENLEDMFAAGEATPLRLDLYQRLTNTLRRCLEATGLKRRAKDVTEFSLGDVLREGLRRDLEAADLEIEMEAD